MWISWSIAGAVASLLSISSVVVAAKDDPYDARAQAIVDGFTTAQVIGQMTQVDISTVMNPDDNTLNEDNVRAYAQQYVGSYLNTIWDEPLGDKYGWNATEWRGIVSRIQEITMEENGGHPIIYGLDSVHGANYVSGAVLFGQQINSGASFNPDLVHKAGRITARDTQAAGIPWVFGPILEISQNPLWSRTYETFSEDPYLVAVMGEALVRGLQSYNQTAACMKHFIGYSKTPTGHDRDNVIMADFDLLNYFLPPFKAAIEAGAMSTMENYISINGDPVIANPRILNDLLRSDLGFDGLQVSDWAEINNLKDWHRVAETYEDAVRLSLTHTSLDMSMVPNDTSFINYTERMLESYPQYEGRLRESAKRIVKTKVKLGLYDTPVPGAEFEFQVGNDADKAVALDLARESIVLLKNNESVLPLAKEASVFLSGHSADNVGHQCGGWSIAWQGYSGNEMFPNGISVRQGFENLVGNDSFTYFNGLYDNGSYSEADLAKAVELASQHEYTIAVIGEKQYTEKPGDIDDLALPAGQIEYVEALAATGTKVIVVLFEGRPRLLGSLPDSASAIIDGLLPCELGGQAMAEIIYGEVNPSGRLPITYPKDPANVAIPYYHRVNTQCAYDHCWMQWDFGAGLSYTEFNCSAVTLDTTTITSADATVTATVTVTNVGTRAGKETVMLFLTQPYRTISVPEVKMLKKFKKIELQAGESQEVSFALTADDWSVYDPQIGSGFKKVTEDSNYVVAIKPDTWCNVYKNITNPLCAVFTIDTGRDNFGLPPPVANVTTSTPVIDVTGPSTTEPPAGEAGAGTVEAASY
ncbi:Lysosomal beta glucosidase [Phytophthora fragariae]|uniref:beta-glucosidase n=1 Tax=Phytophthora fragariae TaxID=53985 RepID=A0A6A4DX98_9STRA|nr:Lysosomal beta glucosidase [Phytophthora fragariae]KAE9116627.1 Lysosomal beta glucosidase [Phytophthora fragariae]KAE9146493.1 Lysosomal beta glucosidase [Phytophthora fragariae]KAE9215261.1 Lysosomal beta glucosidase [Phytophthora fragariae]KAE9237915.1 Lysosomal beta glucosidase [Phytophthora fragariae]